MPADPSPHSQVERRWTLVGRVMGAPGLQTHTVVIRPGSGPLIAGHKSVEVMPVAEHEAREAELEKERDEARAATRRQVAGREAEARLLADARAELERLAKAVEPFTVDGGVGCGREESDDLDEAYERAETFLTITPCSDQAIDISNASVPATDGNDDGGGPEPDGGLAPENFECCSGDGEHEPFCDCCQYASAAPGNALAALLGKTLPFLPDGGGHPDSLQGRVLAALSEFPETSLCSDREGLVLEYRVNDYEGIHGPLALELAEKLHRELADADPPPPRSPVIEFRPAGPWRPFAQPQLHGCEGEPFSETTADGAEPTEATYLERVTLPEREQAIDRLVEEFGMSRAAHRNLRPIYMRWVEGGSMAWIECPADHPNAVPFWKDDPTQPAVPVPQEGSEDWQRGVVAALIDIQCHGALTENERHMIDVARSALAAVPESLKGEIVAEQYAELEAAAPDSPDQGGDGR